jgi:chromosome segregation ATPase
VAEREGLEKEWEEIIERIKNMQASLKANRQRIRDLEKLIGSKSDKQRTDKSANLELEKAKAELKVLRARIDNIALNIKIARKRAGEIKLKISSVNKIHKNYFSKLIAKEFDQLKSNEAVKLIRVFDKTIEIVTKELILEKRLIGRLKIILNMDENEFYVFNLDNVINDSFHPHVDDEGVACFGTAADHIKELLEQGYYAAAFLRIWDRLNKYSADGSMADITEWPKVKAGKRG